MAHIWKNNDLKEIWLAQQNLVCGQNPTSVTIDITGLTVIDMTDNEYADIVILTSDNAAESIDTIINTLSNKNIIFRPESGLTVTFDNKSAGVVTSNLILFAKEQIPNGTKFGFIELRKRTYAIALDPEPATGFFEVSFMDEYFTL